MNASSQFHIQTSPLQVPLELLALGAETPVIGIEPNGAHYTTAAKLAAYIRETIERQAAGRFYLWEAAQILAETHEKSLKGVKDAMRKAFSLGVLRVRMTDSDAPMDSDSRLRVEGMDSYVTPCDLNKWLETDGYPYRFPAAPEPASTPAVAAVAPTPASASAPAVAVPERVALPPAESKEARQARRYQACIDCGLKMPTDTYTRLPTGINRLAEHERITRQAFAEDVKAHIGRLHGR